MPIVHILFLADAVFEDLPGGSRTVARELARELLILGHKVTFLVGHQRPGTPDDEVLSGYRVIRYPGAGEGKRFNDEGEAAARRLLDAGEKFDLVHTHFAWAALGPLKALKGIPHVRSFYGPWHDESRVEDLARAARAANPLKKAALAALAPVKWAAKRKIERENVTSAARTVVLSEHSIHEVTDLGYPREKIVKIPAGADIARFTLEGRPGARARLGLPEDVPILFSVRRLAPRMGLENLIAAMPAVVKQHPEALLLLGGKGPLAGFLQSEVERLGLSQNVRLLGFIPDDALADHYRAANLFVLPTVSLEGFGLITVEAFACGTPVLGTPVGAIPEVLRPFDPQLLARDSSPDALAEGVLRLLGSDLNTTFPPEKLRAYVEENYTWQRHTAGVVEVYKEALREHDRS
jgi:glycosyltransferase involved in cell wall biosynthesis